MLTLTKDFSFDASHRLIKLDWSESENKEVYGKCFNAPSHGHTYKLSVTLEGIPDESGMIINFSELKKIVNENVIEKFDHNYLNQFFNKPSTCEVMVADIYYTLKPLLSSEPDSSKNYKLKRVDLYEQIYPTNSFASYQE